MLLSVLLQCPDGAPPPCRGASRATAANSVAVLYFDNATRDSGDAYLADGLTEAIIVRLGQLGRLEVKSRGSVRRFRHSPLAPATLGRQLGVAHLVNGTVRRSGSRLRVTVELVRSATGNQVWSEQFDRSGTDLLAIEEDIASSVATAIAGRLLPDERSRLARRPTRSAAAYDHYLRGNYYLGLRTPQATARAFSEFESATRADPAFSGAFARSAYAYSLAIGWGWSLGGLPRDSLLARGNAAADRALALDSASADAWLGKASLLPPSGRMRGVLDMLDRAVALDPRNDEARHFRGWAHFVGAYDLARAEADFRAALALEPQRAVTQWYRALLAYAQRRHGESLALADSALAIDPGFFMATVLRAMNRVHLGHVAAARLDLADLESGSLTGPAAGMTELAGVIADQHAGDSAAMRRRLDRLRPGGSPAPRAKWQLPAALLLAHLGAADDAMAVLRRNTDPAALDWVILQMHDFDVLRQHPAFQQYLDTIRPGPMR